jgi:hypothetical protein
MVGVAEDDLGPGLAELAGSEALHAGFGPAENEGGGVKTSVWRGDTATAGGGAAGGVWRREGGREGGRKGRRE